VRQSKQSGSRSLKSPSMCSKPRASTSSFFVTIPLRATSLARSPPAANRPVRGRRYLRAVGRFHRPVPECLLRLSSLCLPTHLGISPLAVTATSQNFTICQPAPPDSNLPPL
jgi:hypothetical protein